MENGFCIQLAKSSAVEEVLPLRKALWNHMSLEDHRKELESLFTESETFIFLSKDLMGVAVGFAEVTLKPHANGCDFSPVLYLEGIWVNPTHQSQGIGRQLIQKIIEFAKAREIPGLASDALIENDRSHRAHLSWGFREVERVVCYSMSLE